MKYIMFIAKPQHIKLVHSEKIKLHSIQFTFYNRYEKVG